MGNSLQEFKARHNHSDLGFNDTCFIFAVNTSGNASQEMEYVKARLGRCANIKQVEGSWDGKREISYAVFPGKDEWLYYKATFDAVVQLAKLHDQESILVIDPRTEKGRTARMHWMRDNIVQSLTGHFVAVPPAEAMKEQGWTRDGNNFYVIK